jgi:hypothetical protein
MQKIIFFSEMLNGKCSRGGQKRRFKGTHKPSLKSFNIKTDTWEISSQEQASWYSCLYNMAFSCETSRKGAAEMQRRKRKTT